MKALAHLVTVAFLLAVASIGHALAQAGDYPNRTVTIIAPSAPGGLFSLFARLIGHRLEPRQGLTFVVANRPGAATAVGAVTTVRAAPDGYTLMIANSTTLSINSTLHKKLPYDRPTLPRSPCSRAFHMYWW
jgi:tripartite-type tricarboxylate transporter receptor subunit TctC